MSGLSLRKWRRPVVICLVCLFSMLPPALARLGPGILGKPDPPVECGEEDSTEPLHLLYLDISGSLRSLEPSDKEGCFELSPDLESFLSVVIKDPAAQQSDEEKIGSKLEQAVQSNLIQLFVFAENISDVKKVDAKAIEPKGRFCVPPTTKEKVNSKLTMVHKPLVHASQAAAECSRRFIVATLVTDLVDNPGKSNRPTGESVTMPGNSDLIGRHNRSNLQLDVVVGATLPNQVKDLSHIGYSRAVFVDLLLAELPKSIRFSGLKDLPEDALPGVRTEAAVVTARRYKRLRKSSADLQIDSVINGWIVEVPETTALESVSLACGNRLEDIQLESRLLPKAIGASSSAFFQKYFVTARDCNINPCSDNVTLSLRETGGMLLSKIVEQFPTFLCNGRVRLSDHSFGSLGSKLDLSLEILGPVENRPNFAGCPILGNVNWDRASSRPDLQIVMKPEDVHSFIASKGGTRYGCECSADLSLQQASRLSSASVATIVTRATDERTMHWSDLDVLEGDYSPRLWRTIFLIFLFIDLIRRLVWRRLHFVGCLGIGIGVLSVFASRPPGVLEELLVYSGAPWLLLLVMCWCLVLICSEAIERWETIKRLCLMGRLSLAKGCVQQLTALFSGLLWLLASLTIMTVVVSNLATERGDSLVFQTGGEVTLTCKKT